MRRRPRWVGRDAPPPPGAAFMAAIAVHPYLINLSRMIMTEPVTLAFQMGPWRSFPGVAAPRSQTRPRAGARLFPHGVGPRFRDHLVAGIRVVFCRRAQAEMARRGDPIDGGPARRCRNVLDLENQPLTIGASFAADFPSMQPKACFGMPASCGASLLHAPGAHADVAGHDPGRMGLFCAPWLFRVTFVVFAVLFYRLVILNYYNFCHVIIPEWRWPRGARTCSSSRPPVHRAPPATGPDGRTRAASPPRWRWG